MEQTQRYKQLFVGGDLSGIQKFLYNISSKKAAVSLKGRSKFLDEYMKGVCKELCEAAKVAGATKTEEIYNSGGKFYFLTDNTDAVAQAIDAVVQKNTEELWNEHFGQLGLTVCYTPFTGHEDGTVDAEGQTGVLPGILWKTVNAAFNQGKRQKFKSLVTDRFNAFFEPIPVNDKTEVCAITGVESARCVKMPLPKGNGEGGEEEQRYVLPSVREQIERGEKLRESEGFKTFEEYAGNSYLGVLRMDVDGLGKRFVEGFKSITDYQAFSAKLTTFFGTELREIQQKDYPDDLNIIYAGGDDLFAVGRWDKVIDFAERIHNEVTERFAKDRLTISGGVAIVHPKFPIAKAAEQAGEAEEAAKRFNEGKKNAFHFLGRTVSWDGEFGKVKLYKDKFLELVRNYNLSRSLLHKMMLYASIAEKNLLREKKGKPLDYSYYWHASYFLARYKARYKKLEEHKKEKPIQEFCNTLQTFVIKNVRELQLVALAARWAELLLKKEKTSERNN